MSADALRTQADLRIRFEETCCALLDHLLDAEYASEVEAEADRARELWRELRAYERAHWLDLGRELATPALLPAARPACPF